MATSGTSEKTQPKLDDNGKVLNTEGTWRAGTDGAQPGIYMEAAPVVGHSFAQEFYPGAGRGPFRGDQRHGGGDGPVRILPERASTKEWTPWNPT